MVLWPYASEDGLAGRVLGTCRLFVADFHSDLEGMDEPCVWGAIGADLMDAVAFTVGGLRALRALPPTSRHLRFCEDCRKQHLHLTLDALSRVGCAAARSGGGGSKSKPMVPRRASAMTASL